VEGRSTGKGLQEVLHLWWVILVSRVNYFGGRPFGGVPFGCFEIEPLSAVRKWE